MKRSYSNEFKLECIMAALQSGKSSMDIAAEKAISENSLARWIRIYQANPESAYKIQIGSETEKTDRKYAVIAAENEVLKRALAIMAKQWT
jgi:transposase-like protein